MMDTMVWVARVEIHDEGVRAFIFPQLGDEMPLSVAEGIATEWNGNLD